MGRGGGELIISAFFVILWFAGGSEYAEKTRLKLEYTFCTSRQNAKQLLSESDFDIFIGVPMTSGMYSSVGFINSSPVIESELAYAQKPNKDVSEDSLAAYLSDGFTRIPISLMLFTRRHPLQALLIVAVVVVIIAAVIIFFIVRSQKQKAKMQESHNEQLSEALQIEREANEAKTTFLSNMSHDIRTPMNAVIGFSTLLAREPENTVKVREYARKIGAASNHLLGLINGILDISKIESGRMSLRHSVFSIDELMESINIVIRPMAGEKKQTFTVNIEKMSHELFVGDKTRINQILINLLSNAIKYTPVGGDIRFDVSDIGGTSSSVENIRFVVTDNGYGITDEFKKIIFDPFTRAEDSTVNKETGTGLGLAITKNIIDLMGGTIRINSTPGNAAVT